MAAIFTRPAPNDDDWFKFTALEDNQTLELELILADIEVVERRLDRAKKNAKSGDKKYKREMEMCTALLAHLEEGLPAPIPDPEL